MTIIKFTTPSDKDIVNAIDAPEKSAIDFVGRGSIYQNLKETIYVRLIKFREEDLVKKVTYKKTGILWDFVSIEDTSV